MDEQKFKALSVEQRKAVQRKLQDAGHYTGAIDGQWGGTTESAIGLEAKAEREAAAKAEGKEAAARADKIRETELELKRIELLQAGKTKEVEDEGTKAANAEKIAKAMRQQRYDEDASSGLGMGAKIAAGPAALMGGKALGLGLGRAMNASMDEGQRDRNKTLVRAAEDRVKGLTTREGAIAGTKLAGAMPFGNSTMRAASRMAPHVGLGALALGTGAELLGDVDPDQPFYPRMADRGFGLANIGAGTGFITQGIKQAAQPGVSPDAAALSIINSSQLRRKGDAPEAPQLTAREALVAEAKAAGITGTSKMNMTALKGALTKAAGKTPLIGPAIAGALAYGMTPDEAQAADGTGGGGNRAEALTNAGVAGTAAAGTGYGLAKLLEKAPNLARALGIGGGMTAPLMAMEMGPNTPEAANAERSQIAVNYPRLAAALGLHDEMGQALPERNTGKADEFAQARALQIPEGIPLPQPDGASPYPDLAAAMMAQQGPAPQPQLPPSMHSRRLLSAMAGQR